MKPREITQLEQLARDVIGDTKAPELYFVSDQGVIVTVTRSAAIAYAHWKQLAARRPLVESALEQRSYGVLASVEPADDTGVLRVYPPESGKTIGVRLVGVLHT